MSQSTLEQLKRLHHAWNRESSQNIKMGVCSYELECGYLELIRAGHTEQELADVVRYLKAQVAKGERKPAALRWSNVCGSLLRFEEELELANGAKRQKPPVSAVQRAVNTLRPTVAQVTPKDAQSSAVHVGVLIANLKRAAGMNVA